MSAIAFTLLIEAGNFLVLVGVLFWLLFQPVQAALEQRRAERERLDAETKQKLTEAERIRNEITRQRAELDTELARYRTEVRLVAEREADQIRREARESADRELASVKERAGALEQAEVERLSVIVADTAGLAVSKLLQSLSQRDLHQTLIAEACRRMGEFNGNPLGTIRVESSAPLSVEDRSVLERAFGPTAHSVEFQLTTGLGCGVRLTTNRGLIDATSNGVAAFVARELAARMTSEPRETKGEPPDVQRG